MAEMVQPKKSRQSLSVDGRALDCAQCRMTVSPGTVFQCDNAHVVCGVCVKTKKQCKICKVKYGPNPASGEVLLLKLLVGSIRQPCPFGHYGCKETIFNKDLQTHVESCKFGHAQFCVLLQEECSEIVSSGEKLFQHLQEKHKQNVMVNYGLRNIKGYIGYNDNEDSSCALAFEHEGHKFVLTILKESNNPAGEILKFKTFYVGDDPKIDNVYQVFGTIWDKSIPKKQIVSKWLEPVLNYRTATKMKISGVPIPCTYCILTSTLAFYLKCQDKNTILLDVCFRVLRADRDRQDGIELF